MSNIALNFVVFQIAHLVLMMVVDFERANYGITEMKRPDRLRQRCLGRNY